MLDDLSSVINVQGLHFHSPFGHVLVDTFPPCVAKTSNGVGCWFLQATVKSPSGDEDDLVGIIIEFRLLLADSSG